MKTKIILSKLKQKLTNYPISVQIIIYSILLSVLLFFASSYVLYCNDAYLRSDFVYVVPRVEGYITKINVKNNQLIKQDTLMVEVNSVTYQAKVDYLLAQINAAKLDLLSAEQSYKAAISTRDSVDSELKLARNTLRRYQELLKDNFVSKERIEKLQNNVKILSENYEKSIIQITQVEINLKKQKVNIDKLNAELSDAEYMLSMTKISSSIEGYINNLELSVGDYVSPGKPLFGITGSKNWRIIANYKQADLAHIKIGDRVIVYIPNFPWRLWLGKVSAIGRAVARNSTGENPALPFIEPVTDWIRYPYRFPVYIDLDNLPSANDLYMGMDIYTLIVP